MNTTGNEHVRFVVDVTRYVIGDEENTKRHSSVEIDSVPGHDDGLKIDTRLDPADLCSVALERLARENQTPPHTGPGSGKGARTVDVDVDEEVIEEAHAAGLVRPVSYEFTEEGDEYLRGWLKEAEAEHKNKLQEAEDKDKST